MNRLKLLLLGCVAVLAFGCGTPSDEGVPENESAPHATQELTGCDPSLPLCSTLQGSSCSALNAETPCCITDTSGTWESACVCFRAGATQPPYQWVCAF